MTDPAIHKYSYFPGCSLATTAKENNASMVAFSRKIGVELVELEDWNCCGSSSAHSIDSELAAALPARNLSLAPEGRPLLVACPSCLLRLRQAQLHLLQNKDQQQWYQGTFDRPVDTQLEILHFFELLERLDISDVMPDAFERLKGLRFAPYYGCMLARPPELRHEKNYYGLMEKVLTSLGASPVHWRFASRCCGTFLSVVRPDVVTPMVNSIVDGARQAGAECVITACAMCHLNLEVRCTLPDSVPILHFSEALSLALGTAESDGWFSRHLVDPRPMLEQRGLLHSNG